MDGTEDNMLWEDIKDDTVILVKTRLILSATVTPWNNLTNFLVSLMIVIKNFNVQT